MADTQALASSLTTMRSSFDKGHTRPYAWRKKQLEKLKEVLLQYESRIYAALAADLGKGKEETWVTELGFILGEIKSLEKGLSKWMRPEKVSTNLLNFPSRSFIYREPLGVVLIIGPWNYPLQLLLAPLAGALAAGNIAVLKPSENAPATAGLVSRMMAAAFNADDVLVVEGDGAEVVPAMMENFRFDHVFYTGSTQVGRSIYEMAAKKLVPVTLELGGKSPCVVESDANIGVAAKRIALTKFSNAGQTCVAPDYVLVHSSVKEAFLEAMVRTIRSFFTDDAARSSSYGRIINERAFNRLAKYIDAGTVRYGGQKDAATKFIGPTILDNVPVDAVVMGEEIFGPVLPVLTFDRFEEGRSIIEKNPDPLAFYVFTGNKEKEKLWIEGIAFGGGCVNNASWHLTNPDLPFGGRGNSGIGAYHGRASFELFTHRKSVMKTPTWFDPAIKYPPFEGKLKLIKKLIR